MSDAPASRVVETIERALTSNQCRKKSFHGELITDAQAIARALTEAGLVALPCTGDPDTCARCDGSACYEVAETPKASADLIRHLQAEIDYARSIESLSISVLLENLDTLIAAVRPPETPKAWTEEDENAAVR